MTATQTTTTAGFGTLCTGSNWDTLAGGSLQCADCGHTKRAPLSGHGLHCAACGMTTLHQRTAAGAVCQGCGETHDWHPVNTPGFEECLDCGEIRKRPPAAAGNETEQEE